MSHSKPRTHLNALNIPLGIVVTIYGLYYLIKRLDEQKPKLVAPLRKAETLKVSRLQTA